MGTRERHQAILVAVTLPVVVALLVLVPGWWFYGLPFRWFLFLWVSYAVFAGIFSLWCVLTVPAEKKKRPPMPPEFGKLRLGKPSGTVARLLESGTLVDTREQRKGTHRLVRVERVYETGTWTCLMEECSGEILAYSVCFRSDVTPVLDRGKSEGAGVFFGDDGPMMRG